MLRPTGRLAHHQFVVLSKGIGQAITWLYNKEIPFELPPQFAEHSGFLREYWTAESPNLTDGDSIVHLDQVRVEKHRMRLHCQPTRYFDFLFSNYSLDVPLLAGKTLRELNKNINLLGLMPDFIDTEWYALKLAPLGNSLGITVSIVTIDGYLIVARRSREATSLARDKGNWLCAVGTQIKRHQPRFLNEIGEPSPWISAREGVRDEMGKVISASCSEISCLGLVYRYDFHHCELLYEAASCLEAEELVKIWRSTEVPDKREFEEIRGVDISNPNVLLDHLSDPGQAWSPQHAAGALHSLARRFPEAVRKAGLDLQ